MHLGVDVDGVLANFTDAYATILNKKSGIEFPKSSDTWPTEWYWDRAAGVTPEQEMLAWREIHNNPQFWVELDAMPGAKECIMQLNAYVKRGEGTVYFITQRSGRRAKLQTEHWLYGLGMDYPTVCTVTDANLKVPIIKALGITFFIDDKVETVMDVASILPPMIDTQRLFWLFLKKMPYNVPRPYPAQVNVVEDLETAMRTVGIWKE